jgi:hypothetical protein
MVPGINTLAYLSPTANNQEEHKFDIKLTLVVPNFQFTLELSS